MRTAIQRHNARFQVDVEGFASGVSYSCSNLKEDLQAVAEVLRSKGGSLPGYLPACPEKNPAECYQVSGEHLEIFTAGKSLSCDGKGDANPLLAVLRARSVARELGVKLCGAAPNDACPWSLGAKIELPGSGTGGIENQRFRIYIRRFVD